MHSFCKITVISLFQVALCSTPAAAARCVWADADSMQTANVQSASGRITAVQGNTFTLEHSSPPQRSETEQSSNPKTLTLTIDQDTDVYGRIAVGAQATVTYRIEGGNNIAVSVRITQQPS